MEYALARYPAIRASQSEVSAAAAGIDLARTAYLPRTDLILLGNRATNNNVSGLLLPQSSIPSISGPIFEDTSYGGVWGSAVGTLFSWEPFDFGLRRANVDLAATVRNQADRRLALTRFEVGVAVADSFLKLLAAQEAVRATQANVERARILAETVGVLVTNQLRPGADESRALAELALARTGLARAQQNEGVQRATLAEWLGVHPSDVVIRSGRLLEMPSPPTVAAQLAAHPVAAAQAAAIEVVRARQRILDRSYFPRFNFQSAFYSRGTGAQPDGRRLGGLSGLAMNTPNWGVGLSVTFPIFDYAAIRARKQIEAQTERAESAHYEQRLQELNGRLGRAQAQVEGARRVAENTPVQLDAARTLEQQASARYQAGLAAVVEVAEAQRLLTQAEIDDGLARLAVWQALFAQAVAEGEMTPLLEQASK